MSFDSEDQSGRLESLLSMGGRLADAVEADIAALEKGEFQDLRTTDPEIARLSLLYAREVSAVKAAGGLKKAPAAIIAKLRKASTRLSHSLLRHERLVACMRQATEGLVAGRVWPQLGTDEYP